MSSHFIFKFGFEKKEEEEYFQKTDVFLILTDVVSLLFTNELMKRMILSVIDTVSKGRVFESKDDVESIENILHVWDVVYFITYVLVVNSDSGWLYSYSYSGFEYYFSVSTEYISLRNEAFSFNRFFFETVYDLKKLFIHHIFLLSNLIVYTLNNKDSIDKEINDENDDALTLSLIEKMFLEKREIQNEYINTVNTVNEDENEDNQTNNPHQNKGKYLKMNIKSFHTSRKNSHNEKKSNDDDNEEEDCLKGVSNKKKTLYSEYSNNNQLSERIVYFPCNLSTNYYSNQDFEYKNLNNKENYKENEKLIDDIDEITYLNTMRNRNNMNSIDNINHISNDINKQSQVQSQLFSHSNNNHNHQSQTETETNIDTNQSKIICKKCVFMKKHDSESEIKEIHNQILHFKEVEVINNALNEKLQKIQIENSDLKGKINEKSMKIDDFHKEISKLNEIKHNYNVLLMENAKLKDRLKENNHHIELRNNLYSLKDMISPRDSIDFQVCPKENFEIICEKRVGCCEKMMNEVDIVEKEYINTLRKVLYYIRITSYMKRKINVYFYLLSFLIFCFSVVFFIGR